MKFPELYRWVDAPMGYNTSPGSPFGMFRIPGRAANGRELRVIAVDGQETGWEHVSVSIEGRRDQCPSWPEMCAVKALFWDTNEAVIQFHPPELDYVNFHPGCLHLWKQSNAEFPIPPAILVGPQSKKVPA